MSNKSLTQEWVSNFLDGVRFRYDSELDLAIAEGIAAYHHESLEQLRDTCIEAALPEFHESIKIWYTEFVNLQHA